jgi:DNA-binding GntR family transcriptional regulator
MSNTDPFDMKIAHTPQTLREIALERLREAIILGHFASGERLVERPLCEKLGVSRSVVREVVRYLEAEGLVEIQPRNGPMVATMDWNRARQIYDIRRLLEAQAAADCARRADASTKADLGQAFKDLEAAYPESDPRVLHKATTRFYEVIFLSAGDDIAWEIVQRLNGRISRLRTLTLATSDRHVSGLARMETIRDAITANDPEGAAQAVQDHLTEAAEIARKLLAASLYAKEKA